jgi:hypothetical protein
MFNWRSSLRARKSDAAARNRTLVHLVREYQDHLAGRAPMDPRHATQLMQWMQRLCHLYVSEYRSRVIREADTPARAAARREMHS